MIGYIMQGSGGKTWGRGARRQVAVRPDSPKENAPTAAEGLDFGWRRHGNTIRLLQDSSLTLLPARQRETAALLTEYYNDGNTLMACLQCGACTVNCHLAETDGALFPRRQMTLLQLGEVDKLQADPTVWLCYNCQDCTSRCPSKASPGRIMAAVRRLAVERYSAPRWYSRMANQLRGFLYMLAAAIAVLLAAIAVGGSFSPEMAQVRYASMLPHSTVNLLFGGLAAMVTIIAAINTTRAWKRFTGEGLENVSLSRLGRSFTLVTRQIAEHRHCATGMKPIRNCMIDGAAVAARVTSLLQETRA